MDIDGVSRAMRDIAEAARGLVELMDHGEPETVALFHLCLTARDIEIIRRMAAWDDSAKPGKLCRFYSEVRHGW